MDSSLAPDFVIRRKHRRSQQAIDPCLGFYPTVPSPSPEPQTLRTVPASYRGPVRECRDVAPPESPSYRPPCDPPKVYPRFVEESSERLVPVKTSYKTSESEVVTVEDFLRWSAKTPLKTYGLRTRKRQFVDIQAAVEEDAREDSEYCESSDLEPVRPPKRVKQVCASSEPDEQPVRSSKPSKKRRSISKKTTRHLAQRLIAAALLSHVDLPTKIDENNTHIAAPLPLTLVSGIPHTPPATRSRPRRWKMVDPKRIVPNCDTGHFRAAVESCKSSKPRAVQKPISQWNPVAFGTTSLSFPKPPPARPSVCLAPFTLVSLEEHDASLLQLAKQHDISIRHRVAKQSTTRSKCNSRADARLTLIVNDPPLVLTPPLCLQPGNVGNASVSESSASRSSDKIAECQLCVHAASPQTLLVPESTAHNLVAADSTSSGTVLNDTTDDSESPKHPHTTFAERFIRPPNFATSGTCHPTTGVAVHSIQYGRSRIPSSPVYASSLTSPLSAGDELAPAIPHARHDPVRARPSTRNSKKPLASLLSFLSRSSGTSRPSTDKPIGSDKVLNVSQSRFPHRTRPIQVRTRPSSSRIDQPSSLSPHRCSPAEMRVHLSATNSPPVAPVSSSESPIICNLSCGSPARGPSPKPLLASGRTSSPESFLDLVTALALRQRQPQIELSLPCADLSGPLMALDEEDDLNGVALDSSIRFFGDLDPGWA